MKTATFPAVRANPELRQANEKMLQEGETRSSFVEQSIRESIERWQLQREFILAKQETEGSLASAEGGVPPTPGCACWGSSNS